MTRAELTAAEVNALLDKAMRDLTDSEAQRNKLASDLAAERQALNAEGRKAYTLQREVTSLRKQLAERRAQ